MSEKNGEIAFQIADWAIDERLVPIKERCQEMIKEALDTKDRDHEALIGVLVGALSKIESDLDDAINGRDPVSDRAMWNEAKEALSHPLVQEYLKKEKKP